MTKEWMSPGGPFSDRKKKSKRWVWLAIISIVIVAAVGFYIFRQPHKQQEADYLAAVAENDYAEVMRQYNEVRELAFGTSGPTSEREKNLALVQEIELAIAEKIHEITAKMSSGAVITAEEEQILSVTGTVSTEIMTTFISEQAANYLTGEIPADSFIKQLNMLQPIERLQPIIKTYADSITELERARPAITAAEENLLEQEWVKAYQLWDDLLAEESA
ncbi:MAG TPA: hypothetical protein GXZ59_07375, partial [Clostridiaceae bacterium]|nr:hypothetical protein [Clostridiaceae bacterium]